MATTIDKQKILASGLPAELAAAVLELLRLAQRPVVKGDPGRGISRIDVDGATGALTITLTDGAIVETGALRGPSAYEDAVQQGFEGSLEDWLASLVGPPGQSATITVYTDAGAFEAAAPGAGELAVLVNA